MASSRSCSASRLIRPSRARLVRSDDGCEGEVRILSEMSGRQKRCNIEHGNDKFVRRDGVYRSCLRDIAKRGKCQALTSCAMLAERHPGRKTEFTVVPVVVLVLLLGIAFAAGYFTRDYV